MRITPKKFISYTLIVVASIYLTFIVDVYTLNTVLKRVFVFGYFTVMCTLLSCLKGHFLKSKQRSLLLPSIALAVLLFIVFQGKLLPREQDISVCLSAGQNAEARSGEVWLVSVSVDGQERKISDIQLRESVGWQYHEEYDDYVFVPSGELSENRLELRFIAENVSLGFAKNAWSGSVTVRDETGNENWLDLYATDEAQGRTIFELDCRRSYSLWERCIYSAGAAVVLSFICSLLLCIAVRAGLARYGIMACEGLARHGVMACEGLARHGAIICFLLLFFTSQRISPDAFTKCFLAVLTAAAYILNRSGRAREWLEGYRTHGKTAAVVVIAVYASLASFAQRFFLDGNTRMHFSVEGVFYVLLGVLWFIPIIYLLLFGMEWLASQRHFREDRTGRKRAFFALLGILCVFQGIILWAFWPGGFPNDNINQFMQAVGRYSLNDWHPVMNALFYRLVYSIIPSIGAIPGVQMFVFALLCTAFLMIGYDYGMSFCSLAVLGSIFIVLPNQACSGICPEKDYPYMLALLWGSYLLIRFIQDPQKIKRKSYLAALALDMFFIFSFRHNGITALLGMILLFIWITVRHFPRVKFNLIYVSMIAVLMIAIYKGPVFAMLNVTKNTFTSYITMLDALGSCVNKDLPLSEDTENILTAVIPLQDWKDYYSRYYGPRFYLWGRDSDKAFDTSHITAEMAFSMYFEALYKYPDVIIKDRMDGMDLLWNISQPSDGFNSKTLDYVENVDETLVNYVNLNLLEQGGGSCYYNRSPLAELYRKTTGIAANNVFDMLLWRTGAYIVLLFVLMLFWWKNGITRMFWPAVPIIGNIMGLVLILYLQSFRYVYAIQIAVVALVFSTICITNSLKQKEPSVPEKS